MTVLVVMHGAQDLHPHLHLGHLQHLKAIDTTNRVVEEPLSKMLVVAQLMRAKSLE